ncbi:hypothetical protein [Bradyrhizobium japonicum]|uniref:hypothetical protein n=1 Tax=Bradyrhizobium japonicum TaxID=375 RepID=UPI001E608D5F|nr:hypothetical protein [Bradyrhizobium japonicum]MCD9821183.1 hypothetical protein [Bradyrhizobium japonicum]MEB2674120.1 hypothetical protein [Bradyrhizobium japonicum]WRI93307.1 hypothetical protein R3F75_21180 [Bradyrhizobium japonicum]
MKRTLIAAAMLLTATAVQAQPLSKVLYARGMWTVATGLSNQGNRLCSLEVRGADRQLYIKNFAGLKQLVVHIFKDGWQFPEKVEVPLTFTFDQYPALPTIGTGNTIVGGISFVEFQVAPEFVVEFLTRLAKGSRLIVNFQSGNEPAWEAILGGSNAAVQVMAQCMLNLTPATQPYSSTQPYSGKQQRPTQPFGGAKSPQATAKPATKDDGGI